MELENALQDNDAEKYYAELEQKLNVAELDALKEIRAMAAPFKLVVEHVDEATGKKCECKDCEKIRDMAKAQPIGYGENIEERHDEALGYAKQKEVVNLMNAQVEAARVKGVINIEQAEEYKALILEFKEVFGTRESVTQMSLLPPMKIRLKEGAKPVQIAHRKVQGHLKDCAVG